ncbi:MAG: bifunctional oligoribonuclease/PAP phosphatase NrnA [Spirochaetota bacterium]|nr:bifunctional oligoribonuclease/PAP phosphatase NrnA [Spirochaetota bacterium]
MFHGILNLDNFFSHHDKFIISTHESPDGDGLGAEIAFNELLKNLGKTSIILNSDPIPDKYRFIDIDKDINILKNGFEFPKDINEYAVFVLDTNDFDNIGLAYQYLKNMVTDVFIIDHHEGGKDKFEANFIKAEASSACEIVYEIMKHHDFDPSFKAAQALYTGILSDTGSFRYPKTTPETFRIASNLVEIGVDPFKIYEQVYENNSLASFELRAKMLSTMEVHFNKRLILMMLTPDMLIETGAPFSEGELNINLPLTLEGIIASVLIKQDINSEIKVSMRTKGEYDVAEIAMANGGGGHKNAAGYKSNLSFGETRKRVLEDIGRLLL